MTERIIMKILTITNSNKCDFAYYIIKLLANAYPNVIAIDNSSYHELFQAAQNITVDQDEDIEVLTRKNITYIKDVDYSPRFFKTFDYVVVYEGDVIQKGYLEHSDMILSMPDCRPFIFKKLINMPENCEYIFRDSIEKINKNSLAELAGIKADQIVGMLPIDAGDYTNYIRLLYNGQQHLKGLSDEYIQALTYVLVKLTGEDEKKVEKYVKKERAKG